MKKRYIILAIACVEILALPAAAQKLGAFDFTLPSVVAATKLPDVFQAESAQRFLVTSDGPFSIVAENAVSDFDIIWLQHGVMGDVEFGKHAKLPGEDYSCAQTGELTKTVIHDAPMGTYQADGEVIDQAVLVEIRYDEGQNPKIKFITDRRAKDLPRAQACPTQAT